MTTIGSTAPTLAPITPSHPLALDTTVAPAPTTVSGTSPTTSPAEPMVCRLLLFAQFPLCLGADQ